MSDVIGEPADPTAPDVSSSPSLRKKARELTAGDPVGEYVIEELLGQGGMGQVYAAVHPVIGKKAAIKVLRIELCMQVDSVERFVREARAVNQIGHPNIVDIFSFGELPDARSYFVMEKLTGESLQARIARKRLTRDELSAFGESIASALDAAHEKQIIHRDLKPENIFLHSVRNARPIIKLLDFGIAKLVGSDEQRLERTRTGAMLGTPMYVAPEQARGHAIDHRVDIYSLGVMFFEIIVGTLPFNADNAMDLVMQHLNEEPPRLRSLDARVPPILDELVNQMLAKEPELRPTLTRVCAVLAELQTMPGGDLVYSVPDGYVGRKPSRARSSPSLLWNTMGDTASGTRDRSGRLALPPSTTITDPQFANTNSARRRRLIGGAIAIAAIVGIAVIALRAQTLSPPSKAMPAAVVPHAMPAAVVPNAMPAADFAVSPIDASPITAVPIDAGPIDAAVVAPATPTKKPGTRGANPHLSGLHSPNNAVPPPVTPPVPPTPLTEDATKKY